MDNNRNAMICRVLALALFLLAAPAWATTYYVDAACPSAGTGTSIDCGLSGPKKLLQDGLDLLTGAGDVLKVRGIHGAHSGCSGDPEGRFFGDEFSINTAMGVTVEPNNYATTPETVYIDGTTYPSSGWMECTWMNSVCNCDLLHQGVQIGGGGETACLDTWYATDSGYATKVIGAQKPDGTPTYRVLTASGTTDMTNAHAGYTGTSPETDSLSDYTAGHAILVRWGQGANAPANDAAHRSYVFYNNNGDGFNLKPGAANITLHGFTLRCHKAASIVVSNPSSAPANITIENNKAYYNAGVGDGSGGSDYGIAVYAATGVTIQNNEIAWTGSEGIHQQARVGAATANSILNNWIHDLGDQTKLGLGVFAAETPSGMILAIDNTASAGDLTGTVVGGNYIANLAALSSSGRCIILEAAADNALLRDNVCYIPAGECVKFDGAAHHSSGNALFNNLCISNGGGGNGYAFWFEGTTNNNLLWNNTAVLGANGALGHSAGGTATGNVFKNNIFYDSANKQLVSWASWGGTFQNNLVYSPTGGTLLAFNGKNSTCAQTIVSADVDNDSVANDNDKCADPVFVNSATNDFHIQGTSPAIDAGTSTGMPTGRTTDINNAVASAHGFPFYDDGDSIVNGVWDIGIDEFVSGGGGGGGHHHKP